MGIKNNNLSHRAVGRVKSTNICKMLKTVSDTEKALISIYYYYNYARDIISNSLEIHYFFPLLANNI